MIAQRSTVAGTSVASMREGAIGRLMARAWRTCDFGGRGAGSRRRRRDESFYLAPPMVSTTFPRA